MIPEKRSWIFRIVTALAAALIFALYCTTINPELSDLSGDSARFLLLARSLATGQGFSEIEKPGNPPHAEYMPGLPVLLAPIYKVSPNDLRPMKFLMVVFAFCSVAFFYFFLFSENRWARFGLALNFALLPFLLRFSTEILSDLPFLAFLLLALGLFERASDRAEPRTRDWIIAGLATALSFYFRQIAVIAFASGLLTILGRKNLRRIKIFAAYLLSFAIPASGWYLRNLLIAGKVEPSYGKKLWYAQASNPFAGTLTTWELIERIFRRISFFSIHLEKDMLVGFQSKIFWDVWIVLFVFFVIGFLYELIKRRHIAAVFFIPYLAAISSWEGWVPRYLLPLLPLCIFFIFRGMALVFGKLLGKESTGKLIATPLILIWAVFNLVRAFSLVSFQHTPLPYPPAQLEAAETTSIKLIGRMNFANFPEAQEWKNKSNAFLLSRSAAYYHFFAMAEWAGKNLQPDEVVVCRKPTLFAWQSHGKSIQYPAELDADRFLAAVSKRGGNYVLIEEVSPELRPVLMEFAKKRPERFELVKLIGQTYLLKLKP